jgi:tRNA-2-methylthio-N6-dimethylallyladenosine synthase
VKHDRLLAIEALQEAIARGLNEALTGRTLPVLVETRADDAGKLSGRTRTGKLVHFDGDAAPGDTVDVRIERATAWSLKGVVAAAVTAP